MAATRITASADDDDDSFDAAARVLLFINSLNVRFDFIEPKQIG